MAGNRNRYLNRNRKITYPSRGCRKSKSSIEINQIYFMFTINSFEADLILPSE